MSIIIRILEKRSIKNIPQCAALCSSKAGVQEEEGEFRVLNLRSLKNQYAQRKKFNKPPVQPPRAGQMDVQQDWGNVWPGPRTFHPATVPLPIRQGYVKKAGAPPDKYGNAELMKIPNFLHLTPPVVQRQCEALKKFCTAFPEQLKKPEVCENYFPFEVTTSDYCHSSVTIRDDMARIVTVKFKLGALQLNAREKDKFLRLVGDRYDEKADCVTIVTDRCPLKKQNYEYAMYLITALYHESKNVEPWEKLKSAADMEYYDWLNSKSRKTIEAIFGKDFKEIENAEQYQQDLSNYMNEGENDYTINNYSNSVRTLLGLPLIQQNTPKQQPVDETNAKT